MGNLMNSSSRSGSPSDSNTLKRFFKKTPIRTILLCGLNHSGKTTLLCNLTSDLIDSVGDDVEQVSTCPTVGVSLVEINQRTSNRVKWRVWDMSGQVSDRNSSDSDSDSDSESDQRYRDSDNEDETKVAEERNDVHE
jgi:GTPase SAR1 family protein